MSQNDPNTAQGVRLEVAGQHLLERQFLHWREPRQHPEPDLKRAILRPSCFRCGARRSGTTFGGSALSHGAPR